MSQSRGGVLAGYWPFHLGSWSSVGQELLGSAIGSIGKKAGVDVSGVAGLAFPKGGGGSAKTAALAAAVVGGANLLANSGVHGAVTSAISKASANGFSGPKVDPGNPGNIGL